MRKNFKKIIAVATAIGLTLSMSISAFANDTNTREAHDGDATTTFDSRATKYATDGIYKYDATSTPASSDTTNVYISVDDEDNAKIYNVTVTWDSLSFTYEFDESSEWDPENHVYGNTSTPGSWGDPKFVTITNHSNAELTTSINKADESETYGVTVKCEITSTSDADLDDASVVAYSDPSKADKAVYSIIPDGVPTKSDLTNTKIATVTVTISCK